MAKKHLFSRLQIKVRPKGLQSFAFYILIFDFPLQSLSHNPLPNMMIQSKTNNHLSLIIWLGALYNCRDISTSIEDSLQIRLFMQNKANFGKAQMNVNKVSIKDYENKTLGGLGKTNPKRTQTKPIKAN